MESPVEQIAITIITAACVVVVRFNDGTSTTISIPSVLKPVVMLKEVEELIRKVEQPYREEIKRLEALLEAKWKQEPWVVQRCVVGPVVVCTPTAYWFEADTYPQKCKWEL